MLVATDDVRDKINLLVAQEGDLPFSQVSSSLLEWLEQIDARSRKSANDRGHRTVIIGFNRIMRGDHVVRDWWPVDGKHRYDPAQNAKEWITRSIPVDQRASLRIETRDDIAAEGDSYWFNGKMSGKEPKPRDDSGF